MLLLIKPFKAQWLLYAPPGFTLENSMFCTQSALICFVLSQNKRRLVTYIALTDWFL